MYKQYHGLAMNTLEQRYLCQVGVWKTVFLALCALLLRVHLGKPLFLT